jgi:acyl-CoA thioesterase FadM
LYYEDRIVVHVSIQAPWSPRLVFNYRIYNQNHKLVTRASNSLVFAKKDSGKLIADPREYLDCFEKASAEIVNQ